jgi:hypothetical protein
LYLKNDVMTDENTVSTSGMLAGVKTNVGVAMESPDQSPLSWSESLKKVKGYFVNIWDNLKEAIQVDTKLTAVLAKSPNPSTSWEKRIDWLKSHWVIVVTLVMATLIVWKFILHPGTSRRYHRSGHHGVNRYGRRY